DKSTNILEVLKLAIRTFDQTTITLASTRAYKGSNHLRVDSEPNAKIPRSSSKLAQNFKLPDSSINPVAVLELLATPSQVRQAFRTNIASETLPKAIHHNHLWTYHRDCIESSIKTSPTCPRPDCKKEELHPQFDTVPAEYIELWKVKIRDVFDLLYDSDELLLAREIGDYYPRSLQKNIHVVVSLPTPTDSYARYFKVISYEVWSLKNLLFMSLASQEVRARAKKLLQKKRSSWLRPDYLHPLLTTP
ncbi:4575_t:CDS:2, partial [Ambispora gerdemannii]